MKVLAELSFEDVVPVPLFPQHHVPTGFHLVEEGSQRWSTKLVVSLGFSYSVRCMVCCIVVWETIESHGHREHNFAHPLGPP